MRWHSVKPAQAVFAPACFILLFLLPLVTGAATQLLPVWLRPGAAREWYAGYRNRIGRHGGTRAVMFLAGGLLVLFGAPQGVVLPLAGLIWFAVQLARAWGRPRNADPG